jgi:hypothetical protein
MIKSIDEAVLIQFSIDNGEQWEDFDSGETFNDALIRTLEICQEDNEPVLFLFKDATGDAMAILGRSPKFPEVFVLTYADPETEAKYYRIRYVDADGRVATEVTSIKPNGQPLGPPVLI